MADKSNKSGGMSWGWLALAAVIVLGFVALMTQQPGWIR